MMHAEVVGAGFAGLVTAISLARQGWSVRLHERGPELRAFGAGIFIWENGLRVLKALGAYEQAIAEAHEAPAFLEEGRDGALIGRHVFGPAIGTRMITMKRQTLYASLLAVLPRDRVEIRLNSNVVAASPEGSVTTEAGETFTGDLVVGADGVHSHVRQSAGLLRSRSRVGFGAIRLLVARAPGDSEAVISHESGGDRRLLYVPCNRQDLYLCFTTAETDEAGQRLPLDKAEWTRSLPRLAEILSRVGDEGRWDPFETIRLTAWSAGRVAIVGDAAHGMTPALGQGAGCAMMNALSLGLAVSQGRPVPAALAAWEAAERPLTEHTQACSESFFDTNVKTGDRWNEVTLRTSRHVPRAFAASA